jgi:hypothetical protein
MEISDNTLQVLKNFASINQNVVINEGNVVQTVSEAKNLLSTSVLDVEFPQTFGIYDLNEFLSVLSLVDSPRLKFEESYVIVGDGTGRSRTKYFYSDIENLTKPNKKGIEMPKAEVSFVLDRETLSRIKRASSVLGHTEMSVSSRDNVLSISVLDVNDRTSNAFSIDLDGEFEDEQFDFIYDIRNLKMIDGDYDVNISSKLISQFVNKEMDLSYWVALEKSSRYGE